MSNAVKYYKHKEDPDHVYWLLRVNSDGSADLVWLNHDDGAIHYPNHPTSWWHITTNVKLPISKCEAKKGYKRSKRARANIPFDEIFTYKQVMA